MLHSMAVLGVSTISAPARAWAAAAYCACSGVSAAAGSSTAAGAAPAARRRVGGAGAAEEAPLPPQAAALVLWAGATLHRPPELCGQLTALVDAAAAGLRCSSSGSVDGGSEEGSNGSGSLSLQQLAAALWGAAGMGAFEAASSGDTDEGVAAADAEPWLAEVFSEHVAAQLGGASLEALLQLAHALACMRAPAPEGWAAAFAAAVVQYLPEATPAHHARLLAVVPLLGGAAAQPALAATLLDATREAMPAYSPAMLGAVLGGVHAMRAVPNAAWSAAAVAAVWAALPALKAAHLVGTLSALARLRTPLPAGFAAAAVAAAAQRLPFMGPQPLVDLIWALTALSHRPGAAWMAAWEARCVDVGMGALDGRQLARCLWCVAALQRRPGAPWVRTFFEAAGAQLPQLEPAR
jgi:hypothetical protein